MCLTCGSVSWHCCLAHTALSISCSLGSNPQQQFPREKQGPTVLTAGEETLQKQNKTPKISSFKLIWAKHKATGLFKRLNSSLGLCLCAKDWLCYTELCLGQGYIWLQRLPWLFESTRSGPEQRRNQHNCWKVWWLHTVCPPEFKSELWCLNPHSAWRYTDHCLQ